MRRPSRSARLVSVCLAGTTAEHVSENRQRIALLQEIIGVIRAKAKWHPIDAIVFPGGLFRLDVPIARKSHAERVKVIEASRFGRAAMEGLELAEMPSDTTLVFGILADGRGANERPDQACVALNARGVVGLARKIFPTDLETSGKRILLQSVADFGSNDRFLKLANGNVAILSACYDLFGLADGKDVSPARTKTIRHLWDGTRIVRQGDEGFRKLRSQCLADWRRQMQERAPAIAIATIHGFDRPGRDGYWQRHGIAAASAALKGGLVVGAANFIARLPDAETSTLAAKRVPKAHLDDALRRTARALQPVDAAELPGPKSRALMRFFTS